MLRKTKILKTLFIVHSSYQ